MQLLQHLASVIEYNIASTMDYLSFCPGLVSGLFFLAYPLRVREQDTVTQCVVITVYTSRST